MAWASQPLAYPKGIKVKKKLTSAMIHRLTRALPQVAEAYFNGTLNDIILNFHEIDATQFGICFNTENVYKAIGFEYMNAYPDVGVLLYDELGFVNKGSLEGIHPEPHNWEQRAFMCLFMAEYLKGLYEY